MQPIIAAAVLLWLYGQSRGQQPPPAGPTGPAQPPAGPTGPAQPPAGPTGPAQPPAGPTGPAQPPSGPGPAQPPTPAPGPGTNAWPTQPPTSIANLPYPDGWMAMPSPIPSAVVTRAEQLLNSGFRSQAMDPQSVPTSQRRLEFVAGEWVMFVPYTAPGGKFMVVAWVPKTDTPDEHQAPPAGAPPQAPMPGTVPVSAPTTTPSQGSGGIPSGGAGGGQAAPSTVVKP